MLNATLDKSAPAAFAVWTNRDRAITVLIALLTLALLGFQLHAMAARGPWYDEFYTFYVTRRPLGWTEALRRHWLVDNHPPLFYALSRATDWLGDTIEARRRINALVEIALLALAALAVRRERTHWLLAALFLAFLIAQGPAIVSAAELRSYFVSFAAAALLVLVLTAAWLEGSTARGWRRAALTIALLVAFNTHIATTLLCGAMYAAFLGGALLRRDFALSRALLWPALGAGVLFVAITAIQFPLWENNTRSFWITPGFSAARWAIEMALIRAIEANLLLAATGALGLALLMADALRQHVMDRRLQAALILGLGAALGAAMLLAIHVLWRPFVIERYLTALLPMLGMALVLSLTRLLQPLGPRAGAGLLVAISALSLVTLARNTEATIAKTTWRGTAAAIGAKTAQCQDAAVHIAPARWNADLLALAPADNAAVVPFAYRTMAARYGFAIEAASSRRVSATCPTLFWAEQGQRHVSSAADILRDVRGDGFTFSTLTVRRIGDGWIAEGR